MNKASKKRIEFAQFVADCIEHGRKNSRAPRIPATAARLTELSRRMSSLQKTKESYHGMPPQMITAQFDNVFAEALEIATAIGASNIFHDTNTNQLWIGFSPFQFEIPESI
jgi:hypothetical protein